MTASTQSAPVRHWHAGTRATRNPSLIRKARTVDPIMHQRLARREQRRAAQRRPVEAQRRIETLETLLHITQERMIADSLLLRTGSTHIPEPRTAPEAPEGHPESLTAELPEDQEIALAALSNDLWPHDEYLEITPDGDLLPAMADIRSCAKCGWTGTGGSCWCPRRTR